MANEPDGPMARSASAGTLEARLERGEVLFFPTCPFALPAVAEMAVLQDVQLGRLAKNVSFDCSTGRVAGFQRKHETRPAQLRGIFAPFSQAVQQWVATTLPRYEGGCRPDQASFRPLEEATRCLRPKARNDLLHVDAFPSRPARDHRILRVFANVNPKEPRIWVTSEPFVKLLARYGEEAGLPGRHRAGLLEQLGQQLVCLFHSGKRRRTPCDAFMLRFHDYLKANEEFQESARKKLWTFPPGSAWMAMTDACSHAVLRGRLALEHSFFVAPSVQVLPEESPAALVRQARRATARPVAARRAA